MSATTDRLATPVLFAASDIFGYLRCQPAQPDNGLTVDLQPMKKFPRDSHRRKAKPGNPDRPSRASSNERIGQSHRREGGKEARRQPRLSREVAVLYEEDGVIVLNKPAGLLAVPIKSSDVPSALSLLIAELKPLRQRALIVHRIDRFASGILLFAKTDRDRGALIRQFLAHTPVRKYLAVVRGRLKDESGTLVHYFRREGMHQQLRTARDPEAARAELRYSVERVFADATLVRVELVTGLQNQIRAQFSAMGHPLIGDRKYHPKEAEERLIDRVALHAAYLEFAHPRSGETITIECPPPQDFQNLLRQLSRSGHPKR
jgi:23S rRNA pseudouridine1911/1915/1917 synthase